MSICPQRILLHRIRKEKETKRTEHPATVHWKEEQKNTEEEKEASKQARKHDIAPNLGLCVCVCACISAAACIPGVSSLAGDAPVRETAELNA